MRVCDVSGQETHVGSIPQLESLLQRRDDNGANAFWMSHDNPYPLLSLVVKDELAALHYIPGERAAGYRSVGKMKDGKSDGVTRFPISRHPADDVFVLNEGLVPFSAALEAGKEFFHLGALPRCIEWTDL